MTHTHTMPHSIYNLYSEPLSSQELIDSLIEFDELQKTIEIAVDQALWQKKDQLLTVTLPFERVDPLAALELLGTNSEYQYYWEHPDEKLSIAAGTEIARIRSNSRDRFNIVNNKIADWKSRTFSFQTLTHSLAGLHFLGGFSFQDNPQEHHWKEFGTALFVIPEWLLIRDGELSLLTLTKRIDSSQSVETLLDETRHRLMQIVDQVRLFTKSESSCNNGHATEDSYFEIDAKPSARDTWFSAINSAKERIKAGEFKKIVLAREIILRFKRAPEATQMLNYLRNEYPTCYTFMMKLSANSVFLGSTPEKLVALRATFILTDGLAGTISRGKTASEDTILERRLLNSEKDLSEHGFVVDAIGDRLRTLTHNMVHPDKPGIRKYPNVQHLYTPITASLNEHITPLDVVENLHPTPAVGGFPREKTIQHIQSLEQFDRGWYAGPVGWLNTNGRGEFCVAIRSGVILDKQARFFAGCGIVTDSDPGSEWEETNLKLIPMLSALKHA